MSQTIVINIMLKHIEVSETTAYGTITILEFARGSLQEVHPSSPILQVQVRLGAVGQKPQEQVSRDSGRKP